jgi:NitT/TauT family transport system permease protein
MAQSFDVPTAGIVRKIVLPGALPALLSGVRVSASIAIVLLIGAEMIAAQWGVGALALNSGSLMRTDRLFAAVAVLGAFGLAVAWTVGLAERMLLRWR